MRCVLVIALVAGCKSGDVGKAHEQCAKAAAMFERCEEFPTEGSDARLQRELVVDRWRGLCRAVLTGETKQLMNDALEVYRNMSDDVKAALRVQAECTAKATTCVEYAVCER